jgi:hypothetical protein
MSRFMEDKFFAVHCLHDDKILEIGKVIGGIGGNYYLCQGLDFLTHEEGIIRLVHVEHMCPPPSPNDSADYEWLFFEDHEHLKFYLNHQRRSAA